MHRAVAFLNICPLVAVVKALTNQADRSSSSSRALPVRTPQFWQCGSTSCAEVLLCTLGGRSPEEQQPTGLVGFCKEVDMIEAQHKKLILAVDGSLHSNVAIELVANLNWPAGTAVHGWWSRRRSRRHAISARKKRVSCARQLRVSEGGTGRRHSRSPRAWPRGYAAPVRTDCAADLAITTEIQEGRAAEAILNALRP